MRDRTVFITLATFAACAPATTGTPSPGAGPVDPMLTQRGPDTLALTRDLPGLLCTSDIPGLSMAVVEEGRVIWARAFGTVNDPARTPLRTSTVFEAASLSKPVFAYLVMRLVDRGELDLDRPLYTMLEYPRLAHEERYRQITPRIALSHGTGLPNWGGERLTLRFTPGTAYGYSGEGFVYLQKALEHVTGHSLDELAQRDVFGPLGMTRSSFVWQERFAGDAAYGQDWLWRIAPAIRYADGNAAASLLTTATDYARFVGAVMTGRGLSPASWRAYLTPVRESSAGLSVGLGIRVESESGNRVFYHSGNNGRRFTSYMTGDVARGLGFVYFTNASNGTSLVEALSARVLGDERAARNRAEYDRHDDPHLAAIRSVQRAALEHGAEEARERLRVISADSSTRPSLDGILQLADFFAGRGLVPLALEVVEAARGRFPDSASVYLTLGRALETGGDFGAAIESYRRARALGDEDEAERLREWAEERAAARARGVALPPEKLVGYAGVYQERVVTLRDGRLYYEGGTKPVSPLQPMAEDLFELEVDPAIRVRFSADGAGGTAGLTEIWNDGSADVFRRVNRSPALR